MASLTEALRMLGNNEYAVQTSTVGSPARVKFGGLVLDATHPVWKSFMFADEPPVRISINNEQLMADWVVVRYDPKTKTEAIVRR
jgi:hypothetical protein